MSFQACGDEKASSLGATRMTLPYFSWKRSIFVAIMPREKEWAYGMREARYQNGPGNLARGWK
jgi:hypothetical protein